MKKPIVSAILCAAGLLSASLHAGVASAQSWPSKPIRVIQPAGAGSTSDLFNRIILEPVSKAIGQPIVADYKPGAGGVISVNEGARAAPDGYTLITTGLPQLVIAPVINAAIVKYDPLKDFVPLARTVATPNVLYVGNASPFKSLGELVSYAKAHPGELNVGNGGLGTSLHLSAILFAQMAGLRIEHIPYKNNPDMLAAVMGGSIPVMFDNLSAAVVPIQQGQVRPLAVTSAVRSPSVPQVPTVAEGGVSGYEMISWFGLFAPAGTPDAIVERLGAEIAKSMASAEVREGLARIGAPPAYLNSRDFAAFIRTETGKWTPIIKASGIKVE